MIYKSPVFWFVIFTTIMLCAVTYLFTRPPVELGWLGIPEWLYGFILIEGTYCAAMWLFVYRFWNHEESQE